MTKPIDSTIAEKMVQLVCDTATRHVATFACGHTFDASLLANLLRSEVQTGYNGLIDEIRDASRLFNGDPKRISQTLNAACLKFAADAWVKYVAEKGGE